MRVVLFTDNFLPKIDGIVTIICLLHDHLQARGHETLIVGPKTRVTAYNGTPIVGVRGLVVPKYPELTLGPPLPSTFYAVRRFNPDVAHFFHPSMIGGFGLLMATMLGIPRVASFHLDYSRLVHHFGIGYIEPMANFLTWWLFNWADQTLAPSRIMQGRMKDLRVNPARTMLWRRGVDSQQFHPRFRSAAMRERLSGGQPDAPLLLYVGRLSAEKRLADLRPVLQRVPNARLALVGDGPTRAELEAVFAGLPVQFIGYLTGADLSAAFASADMLVFPSALESFGLVLLEAMASGLPVVSARVGGSADVVQEGVNGYTFAVGDIDGLVEGVSRLAQNSAHLHEARLAARAFAERQNWASIMDEVVDLYERLIVELPRQPRLAFWRGKPYLPLG